jgi:hypothetical protein
MIDSRHLHLTFNLREQPLRSLEFGYRSERMTISEKILYHQIHPLKLGTDIVFAIISLYFLWQHELILGLVLHYAPPIIASALVISFAGLNRQRDSAFGRYVKRMMTHTVEAARFAGDIVMVIGAWYHSPITIASGLLIILAAWLSGHVFEGEQT